MPFWRPRRPPPSTPRHRAKKLLPRLSPGFCCAESLSAIRGARPPCLPGLARAGPATATWITISIHRCGAVDREEPERCGWRVLELPASVQSVSRRLLKAPRAPPRLWPHVGGREPRAPRAQGEASGRSRVLGRGRCSHGMGGLPVRLEGDCARTPGVGQMGSRGCRRQTKWSWGCQRLPAPQVIFLRCGGARSRRARVRRGLERWWAGPGGQWAGPHPGPTQAERRSSNTQHCRAAGPKAGDRKNGVGWGVFCQAGTDGYGAALPNAGDKENGEEEGPMVWGGAGAGSGG